MVNESSSIKKMQALLNFANELELLSIMERFKMASWQERDRFWLEIVHSRNRKSHQGVTLNEIRSELYCWFPLYVMCRSEIRHKAKGFQALVLWGILLVFLLYDIIRSKSSKAIGILLLIIMTYFGLFYIFYLLVMLINGNLFRP